VSEWDTRRLSRRRPARAAAAGPGRARDRRLTGTRDGSRRESTAGPSRRYNTTDGAPRSFTSIGSDGTQDAPLERGRTQDVSRPGGPRRRHRRAAGRRCAHRPRGAGGHRRAIKNYGVTTFTDRDVVLKRSTSIWLTGLAVLLHQGADAAKAGSNFFISALAFVMAMPVRRTGRGPKPGRVDPADAMPRLCAPADDLAAASTGRVDAAATCPTGDPAAALKGRVDAAATCV